MKKTLLFLSSFLILMSLSAFAGDGTKENPYTVAELLAQKDALANTDKTVWVKADLKGLGEDGTKTDNADTDVKNMAGFFGDATGTFVGYSWQILGQLNMSELTNTKDLLIALTYGTTGHAYGNTANPQYASNYEPESLHFSLEEVHGALSVDVGTGLRGFHIASCYRVPDDVIAVKVSAGYSSKNGAYVNYTNFDGTNAEGNVYVTPKNAAMVLMAAPGLYDFVLTSALYEQTISNSNALNPGRQDGLNTVSTKKRALFRFVTGEKPGFQRNSQNDGEVTLDSKDEIFLMVSSLTTNFMGYYEFETEAKDWISWKGGQYSDFHEQSGIADVNRETIANNRYFDLQGRRVMTPTNGLYIKDGKKTIINNR